MHRLMPVQALTIMMAVVPTSAFSPQLSGMTRTLHAVTVCKRSPTRTSGSHAGDCARNLFAASAFLSCEPRHRLLKDSCMILNGRVSVRLLSTMRMADGEKKKVVFMGTPEVAAQSLRVILEESKKDGSARICQTLSEHAQECHTARGQGPEVLFVHPGSLLAFCRIRL